MFGATAGVVEEARRGERNAAAVPGYEARGKPKGRPKVPPDRNRFKQFTHSVRRAQQDGNLEQRQAETIAAFLKAADRLISQPSTAWDGARTEEAMTLVHNFKLQWFGPAKPYPA